MVNSNQKITQFLLGSSIGFCLAMFFPISLAWAEDDEAVNNSILQIMPAFIAISISLAAVTATLCFLLGIIKLSRNISEGLPAMEFSLVSSGLGIVIAFTVGLTSFRELNTVLVIATVINTGIFLVSFTWNSAKFIHSFLNSKN